MSVPRPGPNSITRSVSGEPKPRTAKPPTPPASLRTPEKSLDLSQSLPFPKDRLACNNHTRALTSHVIAHGNRSTGDPDRAFQVPSTFLVTASRPRRRCSLRSLSAALERVSVPSDRSQPPSLTTVARRPLVRRAEDIHSPHPLALLRAHARARAVSRLRRPRLAPRARARSSSRPPPSPPRPRTTRPRAKGNATSPPTSTRATNARARVDARALDVRARPRPAYFAQCTIHTFITYQQCHKIRFIHSRSLY